MRHVLDVKKAPAEMVPTMNSLVRKALLGTNRRRGPFFTMVYLQQRASLSYSWTSAETVAVMEEQAEQSLSPLGTTPPDLS